MAAMRQRNAIRADAVANPTSGIGETGVAGAARAVANAVFHATGLRIRDLPDRFLAENRPVRPVSFGVSCARAPPVHIKRL